jgi:phosphoglycerate-specific signal transduction histidine kinase
VEVETNIEDSVLVYGVASALTQVAVNLLLNAYDACDIKGGYHIAVRVLSSADGARSSSKTMAPDLPTATRS